MFDSLFDAFVGEVGLAEMIVCKHQSKVRFSVVKSK
jgi:hypothetical protein